jgi:predicted lipoprotein with Yx(FWY)xxD motif
MTWKRTATGVLAAAALAATAFAVSASDSTVAAANSAVGRAPSPPPTVSAPPRPFLSSGTGPTAGVLVSASGQALYFNDQDTPTSTACVAACAIVWHPLPAPADSTMSVGPDVTGLLSTKRRPDGTMQVTYEGHALYTYTVDAAGNLTGNGLIDSYNGRAFSWHAAAATGAPLPDASSSPSTLPTPFPSGGPGTPSAPSGPGTITPPATPTPTPTPAPAPTPRTVNA